jgi:16S rRNA C967 or C1407 C5-methylase (RsmB/RsmF family)/NOL1/NOP2/fmu family ribosome biogenesis protein
MNVFDSLKVYLSEKNIALLEESLKDDSYHAVILNTNKISDDDFLSTFPNLEKHPIVPHCYTYQKDIYGLGKHVLFNLGAYYISEPSAVLVSYLSSIQGDELILDLCAAPGGKTTQASLKLTDGVIIANDISYKRALILSSNVERMGLGNVIVTNNDFSNIYTKYKNTFDKIILDAPCSGSGMFRKSDKMAADWSYSKVMKCQEEQKKLIKMCYYMLKEGGQLTYSTCSFSFEENEEVVSDLLSNSDGYLLPIMESSMFYRSEILSETIHLFPYLFKGEGHYIAIIKKPGEMIKCSLNVDGGIHQYDNVLSTFNMSNRYNVKILDSVYSLNKKVYTKYLNVLRYGVKAINVSGKVTELDHHLSHFLNSKYSIPLSINEAKLYMKGEQIKKDVPNGWNIVSINGINIGVSKASDGTLKNHYPKGLRY